MKIGIITMHWGRNYGAVLQAYALQEYLTGCGHTVEIINYKPYQYDVHIWDYIIHPWRIMQLKEVLPKEALDKKLKTFRINQLNQTKRYGTYEELKIANFDYDVFMTGSDQILNPSLTLCGDGKPAPVYYLGFAPDKKVKVGYAVSFGCTNYPVNAKSYAMEWSKNFQFLGVREDSGMSILTSFGYQKYHTVVPDPTILLGSRMFKCCNLHNTKEKDTYYYVHTLRSRSIDYSILSSSGTKCIESAKSSVIGIEEWLNNIYNAKALITNSYHAMIMAILMHKPFAIILEKGRMTGMNDRFYTLLSRISLECRIADNKAESIATVLSQAIDWYETDTLIERFRKEGVEYINNCLNTVK